MVYEILVLGMKGYVKLQEFVTEEGARNYIKKYQRTFKGKPLYKIRKR